MPCKTRQAALRGERSKPHYWLGSAAPRRFLCKHPLGGSFKVEQQSMRALLRFEARIDWSTWGRSR